MLYYSPYMILGTISWNSLNIFILELGCETNYHNLKVKVTSFGRATVRYSIFEPSFHITFPGHWTSVPVSLGKQNSLQGFVCSR